MIGWQSMASAPKDGARILIWKRADAMLPYTTAIVHWDGERWIDDGRRFMGLQFPTKWMELPE